MAAFVRCSNSSCVLILIILHSMYLQLYYAINSAKSQWQNLWHNIIILVMQMKYKRIRDLREDKDWTQQEIADMLFINRRTYAAYENGINSMTPETLIKLAKIHNVSVDYLLNLTDEKKPYPLKNRP